MKKTMVGAVAIATIAVPMLLPHAADAQQIEPVHPVPLKIIPTFDCSVSVKGTSGLVTITKKNAGAVDKSTDVVAIVTTPSGKVSAAVCGSGFPEVGSKQIVSFNVPPTKDKDWIYVCTAAQGKTTTACNPPR